MLTSRIPTLVRVLAIAGISLAACTKTTTIDQAWTSPTPQPPLHNVITMFITNNQTLRHAGEDKMAQYLQMRGIRATPSYLLLGDQKPQDVASVKALLSQMGYDGVVTQRIVDRETAVSYAPSTFDGAWGWWGGYYGAADYYWGAYTYEIYRLETNAYSLKSNQLVWSMLTKSVDPSSARKLLDSTAKTVAGELTTRGLAG